jgi:hypothetical protein
MIFGECPYEKCNHPFTTPMGKSPMWEKHVCEKCKNVIWTLHSRMRPLSYTERDFNKEYIIDEETKTIDRRTEHAEDN